MFALAPTKEGSARCDGARVFLVDKVNFDFVDDFNRKFTIWYSIFRGNILKYSRETVKCVS